MKRQSYGRLYAYVGKEYLLSFFLAFVFFFFIFFINQILVLAQKILLKNVNISDVLVLVVLTIPQFLMYTMPFSSLASASMVIGNLSTQNEVLALRSCGIKTSKIFVPIVGISLILSVSTLFIADRMIPYTTEKYKELYAQVLQRIPTLELESYSSTTFGDRVISNGLVDGNTVYDVLIFDDTSSSDRRVVMADKGTFSVVDIDRFIYKIELDNPRILVNDASSVQSYSVASSAHMTMYLNLSSEASGVVTITPSQMSIRQLLSLVKERKVDQDNAIKRRDSDIASSVETLADALFSVENGPGSGSVDSGSEGSGSAGSGVSVANLERQINYINAIKGNNTYSFYYQYYRTELQKKVALSFACTFLVFIAFPISFFRVKNGRLLGFGLSMLIACMYWFLLYYMHTQAIMTGLHPAWFIWFPDALVFFIGLILILRLRKR